MHAYALALYADHVLISDQVASFWLQSRSTYTLSILLKKKKIEYSNIILTLLICPVWLNNCIQTTKDGKTDESLKCQRRRWREGWAGAGGTACVPLHVPCPGDMLNHGTITQAECWAFSSCLVPLRKLEPPTAVPSPTPAGQVPYSAVSQEGGRKQEKKKVERR